MQSNPRGSFRIGSVQKNGNLILKRSDIKWVKRRKKELDVYKREDLESWLWVEQTKMKRPMWTLIYQDTNKVAMYYHGQKQIKTVTCKRQFGIQFIFLL